MYVAVGRRCWGVRVKRFVSGEQAGACDAVRSKAGALLRGIVFPRAFTCCEVATIWRRRGLGGFRSRL